jgi:hypothetical protein
MDIATLDFTVSGAGDYARQDSTYRSPATSALPPAWANTQTLEAGFHVPIPFVDRVSYKHYPEGRALTCPVRPALP